MSELVVENLCKEFQSSAETLQILEDVKLELSEGQDISIVGPSGCGKSTLLYILGTLDKPTSGTVQLNGVDPFSLSAKKLSAFRNENIGFVFQDHHLLPQLTVVENVLLPAMANGTPASEVVQRANHLVESVGLQDRREHLPAALSGGERQRVAVARALLQTPRLLLADEPTGNLDANTTESVAELLFSLPKQEGSMLIVVTHSESVAARASQCLRLENLSLVENS